MTSAVLPFRGGYYTHPFGASWFIVEFLRGNAPEGSNRIDPARGAPQSDIHSAYKLALHIALAEDLAAQDQGAAIEAGTPLTPDQVELRSRYYLDRTPSRLHRMRYSSFTVYFSMLKRLGWVEASGEQEPSLPQDYHENFQPRTYYRLTPQGLAADVPQVFDPVMVLYPHYTREKRSGKKRRYFRVPGLPMRAPRAPRAPAPEGTRLMTQAEADQAFARQAEAEQAEAEEAPAEEAEAEAEEAKTLAEQAEAVITSLRSLPAEEQKAKSLKRLEKALGDIPTEVSEVIAGLDDVESAVEAYQDIKPKGMTPEDYQAEKESAWSDIESALEELEILEE